MNKRTAKLIMYHINPVGEVDMISLPQPAELPAFGEVRGDGELDENVAKESYYFWVYGSTRSFAGEIFLQGDIKYFTINVDEKGDISEDEEDYSVSDTNRFSHNRYYEIGCYNINDERSPAVICHYENSSNRIDYDTSPYCIEKITIALDSEGNPVRKMYGYIQNNLVEEYFDDDADISSLNSGDLICVQKKDGLITAYDEVFDSSIDWDTTPARNDGAFNSMQYIMGIVADYKNGVIAIDVSKSDPSADYDLSNVVYSNSVLENRPVFLLEDDKVSVTSAKFIMPGDKIFLMLYQTDFHAAIIVQ